MVTIGTPLKKTSTKVLLCGSGEIGKEIAIALQKYGIEIVAIDNYDNAPAMQVSQKKYVVNMMNKSELLKIIQLEKPLYIIPEKESINIELLKELENKNFKIIPNAKTIEYTMNREKIRKLAFYDLKIKTSKFKIASSYDEFKSSIYSIGFPCVSKPIMSSSGKGQYILYSKEDIDKSWDHLKEARGSYEKVIIEEYIKFDYEVTLLTIKTNDKILFCKPIGHIQENGDYRLSWQPQKINKNILNKMKRYSKKIVQYFNGNGLYGVEFFIKKDEVFFNEISPRPHDTGMVTLISQNYSEFELHIRSILNLPIKKIHLRNKSASMAIIGENKSLNPKELLYHNIDLVLKNNCEIRLFGKPEIIKKRRLGIILSKDKTIKNAIENCKNALSNLIIEYK